MGQIHRIHEVPLGLRGRAAATDDLSPGFAPSDISASEAAAPAADSSLKPEEIAPIIPEELGISGVSPIPGFSLLARPVREAETFAIELRLELQKRGEFYFDGSRAFYFDDMSSKMIAIEQDNPEFRLLMREYGALPRSPRFGYTVDELDLYSRASGTRVTPCLVSSMDRATGSIYLDRFDGYLYRITADDVELVPNGTDGHLFLPVHGFESFELVSFDRLKGRPLEDNLIELFSLDDEGPMSRELQARAILVWILASMVPELVPVLPGLVIWGIFDSGKTLLLEMIGAALAGREFSVVATPRDSEDFKLLTCEEPLLFLDDCNTASPWLNEALAVAITKCGYHRRKKYTDRGVVATRSIARIGLTSNMPRFTRQDVISRLLIIRSKRPDLKVGKADLIAGVLRRRNLILTDIARSLQLVLRARPRLGAVDLTGHRLVDFAQFTHAVGLAEGWPEGYADRLLRAMLRRQEQFLGELDPLVEPLIGLLEEQPGHVIEEASAREIHGMLVEYVNRHGYRKADIPAINALGQRLTTFVASPPSRNLTTLEHRRGSNRKVYTLRLVEGGGGDA